MPPLTTEQYAWGFASGRIAALESRLLGREFFLGLLAQGKPEEILRALQETPLSASLTPGAVWDDCGHLIDRHYHGLLRSLRGDSPDATPADLFLLQGDYLNLKRALLKQGGEPFLPGRWTPEILAQVTAGDRSALPEDVRRRVEALDALDDAGRRAAVDVMLDGAYLREFLALADALDVPLIREYAETFVLARAMIALWRALRTGQSLRRFREHFLPMGRLSGTIEELMAAGDPAAWPLLLGGDMGAYLAEGLEQPQDEQIARFDRLVGNRLARLAESGRYQAFGPERVFAYFAALSNEAHNLKVSVCGRMNRIDADLLRQRLKETAHG